MPDSSDYTAAMAADPELPPADMQKIAASRPDLLPALASNPALYPALREWLASHTDPAVQQALASHQFQQDQTSQQPRISTVPTPKPEQKSAPQTPQPKLSPFAPDSHQAPRPSAPNASVSSGSVPSTSARSPLDELLSEAPKATPALDDPFSHIPSVNGPEKRSKSRRGMTIFVLLLVLLLVAFSVYWFVIRDDGAAEGSDSGDPGTSLETVTPTTDPTQTFKKPAPVDALDMSQFSSKKGNLQCQITQDDSGQDLVRCTMWKYKFTPDVSCTFEGAPLTYELYSEGPVRKHCSDLDTVSDMPSVAYDTSVAQNGFACTLRERSGFTCWSEESGEMFQIRTQKDWVP